jgi:hypothetical protein
MNITKITLTRGITSFEIVKGGIYSLVSSKGLSGLTAKHKTYSSSNIDGAVYKDSIFDMREVVLEIAIVANKYSSLQVYKDALIAFLNPKLGAIDMKIERAGYKRILQVIPDEIPEFNTKNHFRFTSGKLILLAHNPFLLSENEYSDNLNQWTGGLTFPFSFDVTFSTRGANTKNIINNGQIETPLTIQLYGAATNPKIENTSTGQFIQINKAILSGELLTIDTEIRNASVQLTKTDGTVESAFNYIDIDSLPFFYLQKGDNVLTYSTAEESSNDVFVKYKYRYLGI